MTAAAATSPAPTVPRALRHAASTFGERDAVVDGAVRLDWAGLLDEVITYVAPVTLGTGRPLLPRRLELRLEETARNKDFVANRFSVVGPGVWAD